MNPYVFYNPILRNLVNSRMPGEEESNAVAIAVEGAETPRALLFSGAAAQKAGDLKQATELYSRALDAVRSKGTEEGQPSASVGNQKVVTAAECLRARAAAHASSGDFDLALKDADEAVELCERAFAGGQLQGEEGGDEEDGTSAPATGTVPAGGDTNPARLASLPGRKQTEVLKARREQASVDGRAMSYFRRGESRFMKGLQDRDVADFELAANDFAVAWGLDLGGGSGGATEESLRKRLLVSLEQCEYYKLHLTAGDRVKKGTPSSGTATTGHDVLPVVPSGGDERD